MTDENNQAQDHIEGGINSSTESESQNPGPKSKVKPIVVMVVVLAGLCLLIALNMN